MKIKKITLSLAGVLAAIAFAPEVSAVPVFARQTGMACNACHFNHFPLLNGFGRSFKASGYTLMGAQGKVEGDGLSIPDRLNMAVLTTAGYESLSKAPNNTAATNFSGWFLPTNGGELSIFYGGRVSENSGFLSELALTQGVAGAAGAANTVAVPGAKLLYLPEVGNNTRAGLAFYSIAQDAASSFELLNTGASSIHRMMGKPGAGNAHMNATSARQFVAPETNAAGVSLIVVNTDKGFLNISKYASAAPGTTKVGINGLPGTYVRAAAFFNVAGFDSAVGIQNWSGVQNVIPGAGAAVIAANREEKATIIDGQMQGEIGGKGLGLYASYGEAPATANNVFNGVANAAGAAYSCGAGAACGKVTSFNIAADYGVAPKTTLQAAIRSGKVGVAAGQTQSNNALMLGVGYELALNQHLHFLYTTQSGAAWDNTAAAVNAAQGGKNVTTLLLEQLF